MFYDVTFKMTAQAYYLLVDFEGTGILEEVKSLVERVGYDIRVVIEEDNSVAISCKVNLTKVSIEEVGKVMVELEGIIR